ncbi:MAG: hypothetical protein HUN04_02800 [Desulfobacter sp.]|nr:MAG: hypothetical protein HUN04_02800 [Desulfobacter sp.]
MTEFCTDVNSRTIKMALVDGSQINACVNIDREPGYNRLSDMISNSREPFLVLMNATMHNTGITTPVNYETLFVNKEHILWATPQND